MDPPSKFNLTSTATALAIIVPTRLQPEINGLRKVHDKAYRRWQPHINVLYPFVEPTRLNGAVELLKSGLAAAEELGNLRVDIDDVGVFRHRKNATVFLKPSGVSESAIRKLRAVLTDALGCEESEGTHDGEYRPHLTIGQASLLGGLIEKLVGKTDKVTKIGWNIKSLAVLKREQSGEMKIIEEILIGDQEIDDGEDAEGDSSSSNLNDWSLSYAFTADHGWTRRNQASTKKEGQIERPTGLTVTSYNIMTDPEAPPLSRRGPLVIDNIASATANSNSTSKILCLQEVNEEMLEQLLSHPFIQRTYPYSTHFSSSFLPNRRNLVILASEPFTFFTLEFDERHKSALVASFEDAGIEIANIHLSSSLTDKTVRIKQNQMAAVTKFLLSRQKAGREILLAGDFNLTTSTRTIETALSRNLITPETAESVQNVIGTALWEDAFLKYWALSGENYDDQYEGEEGATFDRLSNPLAAKFEPPIDKSPQRYDRILFRNSGNVQVESFQRFGFPDDHGRCASDHFGVCARLRVAATNEPESELSMRLKASPSQFGAIPLIQEDTDLMPMIAPYLPTDADRIQRRDALDLLQQTLTHDEALEDLVLAPLGSYSMDTYFADSDVDVLAIGSVAPRIFFDLALTQLRVLKNRAPGNEGGVRAVHFVNSLVPIVELVVSGIKIDLQYCQATELLEE
jgi:endonuclease/exonuclease/phosphatase family metal-dependent hydrolase/2'-5' RNA ligase